MLRNKNRRTRTVATGINTGGSVVAFLTIAITHVDMGTPDHPHADPRPPERITGFDTGGGRLSGNALARKGLG